MQNVVERFEEEIEVKRSRFIAVLLPYRDFKEERARLNAVHPKASHIVYAYRFMNECQQIVEQSTDDGEPRGCAGVPILNVMRGKELIDSALLVIRYFGGIKLGTGGMVRAYSAAAKEVIAASTLTEWIVKDTCETVCTYNGLRELEYRLREREITILSKEFLPGTVRLKLMADPEALHRMQRELKRFFIA